ncbi:unnamed protein product [Gongylonema pulchrum]|uniref:TAFH domain-containing protein n=1 Tax=Gongylonema pulchrum TaxID=637853 RepID=A0A183EAA8_9BILA|nr:unnamed protein product [Gongylonema pulchrum]
MGESVPPPSQQQQQQQVGAATGPRFRIVPGPVLAENSRTNDFMHEISSHPVNIASVADDGAIFWSAGSGDADAHFAPQQQQQQQPQQQQVHVVSAATVRSAANAAEQASMVSKCARFFKTLIHLTQHPDQQQTAQRVTELVNQVIYGSMPPEVFTTRLQDALRSQAQPHLLPFLQKTLPALRAALQKGEVTIEGISAPNAQQQQQSFAEISQPSAQWDANQRGNNENAFVQQVQYRYTPTSRDVSVLYYTVRNYLCCTGIPS